MHNSEDGPYILCADDDPDDLKLFKEIIGELNPKVVLHEKTNGTGLISFLDEIPSGKRLPDVLVIDWNMPELNGIETLEKLKRNKVYKKIPAYIFTTSNFAKQKETALASGADGLIVKPFKIAELEDVCRFFIQFLDNPPLLK